MRLLLVLYVLVLGPTALLAAKAWRGAGLEEERHLAVRRDVAEESAKLLATSADIAVGKALFEAESSEVVAYVADGGLRYDPSLADEPATPATPEDRGWYLLSRGGGESFEAAGDPAAALDAYSFHVPRIRSAELRARLRLAAARSAFGAGREALARALLLELFEGAGDAVTEEGYPIDLVAASMLLGRGGVTGADLRGRAALRLGEKAPGLRTPLLARWIDALAEYDGRLRGIVEGRRILEAAVAARPEVLASRDAVLAGSTAVFARDETSGGRRLRVLRAARIALALPHTWPGMEVAWLEPGARAPDGDTDTVTRDFGSIGGRAPLGAVSVRDPGLSAARRAQDRFWSGRRVDVLGHCMMILLGGLFILRSIQKERDLARLRMRLLANVSHELKTPVTSIRMFAEMLAGNGTDPARAEGFARHILRESERLSRLVEDVLDTARPERAGEALHPEPVDMAALIRTVASSFADRAREAGVDFRLEGADPARGEAMVETSAPAVERILSNLLDNALKYRRPKDARIALVLDRVGAGIRIAVRDNGPGIALKDRARVFDEFYRARYDDYAVKGAGLGLAIARRLARRLGGDIRVDSKEGQGSTFTLRLPLKAPSAAGAPQA